MRSNNERRYEIDSYDKAADRVADNIFETLNTKEENNNQSNDKNSTSNKYTAVHIATTGRKAISHGANWIPGGPGSAKIGAESVIGRTLGGEKLSPTQRKLYGLGSALSLVGWSLGRLGIHTGHLRLGLPLPILSTLSSALVAAGQASIMGGDANIGGIFKAKLDEYVHVIKKYVHTIKNSAKDQQTQEQISTVEASIEEVENIIDQTTNEEATNIVTEIIQQSKDKKIIANSDQNTTTQ